MKGFTQLVVRKGFATPATDSESDQAKKFLTRLVLGLFYTDSNLYIMLYCWL